MCGRYAFVSEPQELKTEFPDLRVVEGLPARSNISPGMDVYVIQKKDVPALVPMRWGLVPSWSKDHSSSFKTFNARSETVTEKPTFRTPFKRKRCLIPVNGFYEWKTEGKKKTPHYITLKSKKFIFFAGLYDEWESPNGYLESCSILTTTANKDMSVLHERMPVILKSDDFSEWFDLGSKEKDLLTLLKPLEEGELEIRGWKDPAKEPMGSLFQISPGIS